MRVQQSHAEMLIERFEITCGGRCLFELQTCFRSWISFQIEKDVCGSRLTMTHNAVYLGTFTSGEQDSVS